MTVAGNIAWPLQVARWSKADRNARVDEVLALPGISALRDRYPAEISGGQQQRVAIARTIAPKPMGATARSPSVRIVMARSCCRLPGAVQDLSS